MKRTKFLIVALALVPWPALAESKDHHAHGHDHAAHDEPDGLKLDNGKKWKGDRSLRQGMERIRKAFAPLAAKIHRGDSPAESYASLAKETGAATDFIFGNCRLGPEADAVLHVLLARILGGRAEMEMAEKEKKRAGARKVLAALEDYPRYFQHPGWKPLPRH